MASPTPAVRAEQLLWDLVYAYDDAYERAALEVGLSAAQACVLEHLVDGPATMGRLADEMLCDASNITQLVARLEARTWVERGADPTDRRVKRVALTPAGRRARREVHRRFRLPADRIGRLDPAQQEQLAGLLALMTDPDPERV
ncbi:MarR family transcriptional regulator [Phycicoccus sp. BSK3Z-2]|uniref:MarR family transcriptional regulator n=1 Tax=Phycicoccus avicenniae TaxID=2828860 RepID=A0A941HYN0_9MICO|nr:MarR family transcriptional regulator [Phycicoccus avicenniae]MBR7742025.1 MarR family transcriptional regulator [Phycicoccus avicenniae]